MADPSDDAPSGGNQATGHIEVVNWSKYQHYTDRNPPWIKLYHDLIEDPDFMRLQPAIRWIAVGLFLLAARNDNEIPFDRDFIQWRLKLPEPPKLAPLQNAGLIRIVGNDREAIASRYQDAIPETEAETETEGEERAHEAEQEEMFGESNLPRARDLPKNGTGHILYPEEFEVWWKAYPERRGSNSKKGAYRKWRSTALDGVRPATLYEAVLKYRSFLEADGKIGTKYVMQAKTFLGPDEHWRQAWDDQPASASDPNRKMAKKFRRRVELMKEVEEN